MTQAEIKTETQAQFDLIKKAHERLEELRSICKHVTTFEGIWSWRVGCYDPAIICSDCGNLIKLKNNLSMPATISN